MFSFWMLVIIALIAFFFLLSFIYKPVGRFFGRIFDETKDAIDAIDNENEENENEKETK